MRGGRRLAGASASGGRRGSEQGWRGGTAEKARSGRPRGGAARRAWAPVALPAASGARAAPPAGGGCGASRPAGGGGRALSISSYATCLAKPLSASTCARGGADWAGCQPAGQAAAAGRARLGDSRRQRGLPMIDVPDRANVQVLLGAAVDIVCAVLPPPCRAEARTGAADAALLRPGSTRCRTAPRLAPSCRPAPQQAGARTQKGRDGALRVRGGRPALCPRLLQRQGRGAPARGGERRGVLGLCASKGSRAAEPRRALCGARAARRAVGRASARRAHVR